jgi:hypothetical protein
MRCDISLPSNSCTKFSCGDENFPIHLSLHHEKDIMVTCIVIGYGSRLIK